MSEYEDLDAQLRTWLDEDRQLARWAASTRSGSPGGHWKTGCSCDGECREHGDCERVEGDNITIYNEGGHDADQARHIARWDPATVLADIAGKVALLDALAGNVKRHDSDDRGYAAAMDAWELALTHLAATYVERPEFKDAWRIDG